MCSRSRCRLQSRRRGVAVVALPGDVAMRDAVEQSPRLHFSDARPSVCPSDDEINILADLLNRSKKITILGGAGCAGAHDELIELAGKLQAPIVHAMRGKEFIEYDNPFDVGMTGLLGFSSGYHAMMNCDVLLMIGTDFPYQQFYPKDATIVQIDVRGEQIGRRSKVDFGFVGDTKTTLRALLPKLEQNQYQDAFAGITWSTIARRAKALTIWQPRIPARNRSILNMLRACSINSQPKTRSLPATSELQPSGLRAISR